jgi:xanthine dehydrogenase accessory factor
MLFWPGGVAGFLSGGCVEGDVAAHAALCLEDGAPRQLVYGAGSPWPDIRLLCGVGMRVLVERVGPDDIAAGALLSFMEERTAALWISDGLRRLCTREDEGAAPWPGSFVRRHDPVWRLVVVGGDPTALAIAGLGAQAGLETTLIRPRGPSTPPPITGVAYRREAAAEALALVGLDACSAVAVATHEEEVDHEALMAALPSPAPYIGLLGARRRIPERLERLRTGGVGESELARLKAPIGLDLGGKAPWEIAIAVVGEVIALREAGAVVRR